MTPNVFNPYRFAVLVPNPTWVNRAGYTISTTNTPDDTATNTGSGSSVFWEAYDSETLTTSNTNDIEFQLNGSTFYTASGYAQSTINGYYPVTQNYFGTNMPAAFVASRTAQKYIWKCTNGSSEWQKLNGMDTMIGINDTNDPAFESAKWMIRTGQRSTVKKIEIWRESSSNIEYSASTTLSDNDELAVVYNA